MKRFTKNYFLRLVVLCVVTLSFNVNAQMLPAQTPAPQPPQRATGLKEMTPEEMRYIKKNWRKVQKVNLNTLGLNRVNQHRRKHFMPALDSSWAKPAAEEVVSSVDSTDSSLPVTSGVSASLSASSGSTVLGAGGLPTSVDNSKTIWFPPIGNQGGWGACGSWATTYYQYTYTIARDRNIDIRNWDFNNMYSPKWTYTMANAGKDQGTSLLGNYDVLTKAGAATWQQFPYGGSVTEWDLNPDHWKQAVANRANPNTYISLANVPDGIAQAKQLLVNGHILVFGTWIYSWMLGTVKDNPVSTEDDVYVGKRIAYAMSTSQSGPHAMTIVGYNDDIWVDVNGNSTVDTGEMGAFRVANQWGTGYEDSGFVWIAYDAFNDVSTIPGVASGGRTGIIMGGQLYDLSIRANSTYVPKVLAKVTLNHAMRGEMAVMLAVGDTTTTTQSKVIASAMMFNGGPLAFNGGTTAVDGTFYIDLTDLLPTATAAKKYYLRIQDLNTGNPATVKEYTVMDLTSGSQVSYAGVPFQVDATTVNVPVTYTYAGPTTQLSPLAVMGVSVSSGTAPLAVSFSAAGSVDPKALTLTYDWDFGDGSKTTGFLPSHTYTSSGSFTATLKVTNSDGLSATATKTITVGSVVPSTPTGLAVAVAAGKNTVSWNSAANAAFYNLKRATAAAGPFTNTVVTGTSYVDTAVQGGVTYYYKVSASNANGDSAETTVVSATAATSDTAAPSVPGNVVATAKSTTQIDVSWGASSDNVGVTGYKIYRDGAQVGTSAATSYSDTGLTASTKYTYTVAAYDAAGNVSAASAGASATTLTPPDTQAPSVPGSVTATAKSTTQIDVAWSASTDNVGVVGYKVYRDGTQVGTSTTASYSNTGLNPSTKYTYTVAAYDQAGNTSAVSAGASATTLTPPDTQAPSVPGNVSATAKSTTQIDVTWSASTDNVGVTGYKVYRDGVQVGTSATAAYSDTGLAPSTKYTYTVVAYDQAGNASAVSAGATATTLTPPDTQAPSVPGSVVATAKSTSQIDVTWSVSTDNVGLAGYKVYRNGVQVGISVATAYSDTGLTPSTKYTYTVAAYDQAGNTSVVSAGASATTLTPPDTQAPSVPANLMATAKSTTQIDISWSASSDNVGVVGYKIYRDGSQVAAGTTTSYADTGLTPSTKYTYTVVAYDQAGNASAVSAGATATTLTPPDTQAPSVPGSVVATAKSTSQIDVTWSASTDNVGVVGYKVYRDGVYVSTSSTTSYSSMDLTPSTKYAYTVAAFDLAGNTSAVSAGTSATTLTPPDTQAPSVPASVAATATSPTQIDITWSASSDNVGVAGYKVYRNGQPVGTSGGVVLAGTSATTVYSDTGLNPGTQYTYTVVAYDQAGNASAASAGASAVTPAGSDAVAPTVPTKLQVDRYTKTASQLSLKWIASTDNVGVVGYKVFRNGEEVAITASPTYTDKGLESAKTYSYRVSAYDAAGNESAQSTSASSTTLDNIAPTVPTSLKAVAGKSNIRGRYISLSWTVSTDNVAVYGYRVYRNGTYLTSVRTNAYTNYGLSASTTYVYSVAAYDKAGNVSAQSVPLTAVSVN